MDITLDKLKILADEQGFNIVVIEKDYLVTRLLYLLKDIQGIHFKGGTALHKILLNHERISEDLDFSVTGKLEVVEKEIKSKLKNTIFKKITHDKRVDKFTRLIIHYKMFHDAGIIFVDLNERAKVILKPVNMKIRHFYKDYIDEFSISCLQEDELIAEKVMALCGRYRPRDYLDIYFVIKKKLPVDISLIKRKFRAAGNDFSVLLIFKNANKIYNQWNEDLFMLTKRKLGFKEVMKTLSDYFNLKKEKEKLKETK